MRIKFVIDTRLGVLFLDRHPRVSLTAFPGSLGGAIADNKKLRRANRAKNDEFYTQRKDIEDELKHYGEHFKGKIVLCNCDDPFESEFFKYFALNFNYLGLKKLICTSYAGSPISYTELDLNGLPLFHKDKKLPYMIEITEVADYNGDGAEDLADIEYLLKNNANVLTILDGDGDFRSEECIGFLKEADIVVTNPPFSLFREYLSQLVEYDKKFIIIGNNNAITYKEVFSLIKEDKIWLGYNSNKTFEFRLSDDYERWSRMEDGLKYGKVPAISWFTNMEIGKRNEKIILYKKYDPEIYKVFDELPEIINVGKTNEIPYDYDGYMGVPITFLGKYNPEQFEIIDALNRYTILDYFGVNESVRQRHSHCCNIDGKATYYRIVIKRRKNEN